MTEDQLLIVVVMTAAIALVVTVVAALLAVRRRRQRRRLKEQFGPEYDHAVSASGESGAVENLHERIEERQAFTPAEPSDEERDTFRQRMAALQFRFVDEPADATLELERVVVDALRLCGYPVAQDRERALELFSVDYPNATPSVRELLDGTYGSDIGRMQQLFVDVKRALQNLLRLTYGPADAASDIHLDDRRDAVPPPPPRTPA
jgi:hypothetical protein